LKADASCPNLRVVEEEEDDHGDDGVLCACLFHIVSVPPEAHLPSAHNSLKHPHTQKHARTKSTHELVHALVERVYPRDKERGSSSCSCSLQNSTLELVEGLAHFSLQRFLEALELALALHHAREVLLPRTPREGQRVSQVSEPREAHTRARAARSTETAGGEETDDERTWPMMSLRRPLLAMTPPYLKKPWNLTGWFFDPHTQPPHFSLLVGIFL
jgi:hypothetical protein